MGIGQICNYEVNVVTIETKLLKLRLPGMSRMRS